MPLDLRTKRPLLLTPQRFLRHLPTLGGEEFDKYAERKWRENHREELAKKIVTFDKNKVLDAARKDEKARGEFMQMAASIGGKPYDFNRDRWGVTMPKVAADHLASHPFQFTAPTNGAEMKRFVLYWRTTSSTSSRSRRAGISSGMEHGRRRRRQYSV